MADNEITDSDWHADGIAYEIKRLPSAQRTGRWIDMDDHVMCSCCGATHYGADKNYCPNCGAKMEEKTDG